VSKLKRALIANGDRTTILIRLMVGAVFLSEGIQKFLFAAQLGSGRFEKIGIPHPEFWGPVVGFFEITCGLLVLLGVFTRFAAIPILTIMLVAMASTKSKVLALEGFWPMMHGSRTDWAMFLGALFLLVKGGGAWSVDRWWTLRGTFSREEAGSTDKVGEGLTHNGSSFGDSGVKGNVLKILVVLAGTVGAAVPVKGVMAEGRADSVPITIAELLVRVEKNLPRIQAMRHATSAAQQEIKSAKNKGLPDWRLGYQANIATVNNITGMNYPGLLVPISGPPSASNSWDFVPGTLAGSVISWEPYTFGRRPAEVETAVAQYRLVHAQFNEQLFTAQYQAVQLYLEAVYLKRTVKIADAATHRIQGLLQQSIELAKVGLIAGIDTAQFQSSLLQAEVDQRRAAGNYEEKLKELSLYLGDSLDIHSLVLSDSTFLHYIPSSIDQAADTMLVNNHPLYQSAWRKLKLTESVQNQWNKAWRPTLELWGTLYGRGSGVNENGVVNKSSGWNISRTNAGIGVQLSFPLLGFQEVNTKKLQLSEQYKSDEYALVQTVMDIRNAGERAMVLLQRNRDVALKTPQQVAIAHKIMEGLQMSYAKGLVDYSRLHQAQFELLRAEISDAQAQLQVVQALLHCSVAMGDLTIFLASVKP